LIFWQACHPFGEVYSFLVEYSDAAYDFSAAGSDYEAEEGAV